MALSLPKNQAFPEWMQLLWSIEATYWPAAWTSLTPTKKMPFTEVAGIGTVLKMSVSTLATTEFTTCSSTASLGSSSSVGSSHSAMRTGVPLGGLTPGPAAVP